MIRACRFCDKDISERHLNTRFCSSVCADKERYQRTGQRTTPTQRAKWYAGRVASDGYRDMLRKQGRKRSKAIKDFLAAYKIKKGCADCGYKKHHAALDFDHVSGVKEINVCFAKSIQQALCEIEKCEVVCSNCHRIRSYDRFHARKPDIFEATYFETDNPADEKL